MTTESGSSTVLSGGGEMGALMRSIDWSTTAVGPVDAWPQSLRTALSILLETGFPMYIAWGRDYTQFYNDGYRPILGSTKHPMAMGAGTRETFAEIWDIIGPMFQGVMEGRATNVVDFMLPLDRHGFAEECYFIFSYSPIREESGRVGGVLVTVTETTARVVGERRLKTTQALAAETREAKTAAEACEIAGRVLATNSADLPFSRTFICSPRMVRRRRLAAAWAPPLLVWFCLRRSDWTTTSSPPSFDRATRRCWEAERRQRGTGLPVASSTPGQIVLVPIARQGVDHPLGILVAGTSQRLLLDDAYRDFLTLVASQIGAAIAAAQALEEAEGRAEALAELDRAKTAFFSNVSHEFRTPLTLMIGPTEDALGSPEKALARGGTGNGSSQRAPAAQAREHVAGLFAHRSRTRDRHVRSDGSGGADRRSRQRVPIGHRTGRAATGGRLSAVTERGLRRPRDVGKDRPQSAVERVQVHVPGLDRGGGGGDRQLTSSSACETPGSASRRTISPASSIDFTASNGRRRAPTRVPASAWPWSASWSPSTAAPSTSPASLEKEQYSRCVSRSARRTLRENGSRRSQGEVMLGPPRWAWAPRPTSKRRCDGCPPRRRPTRTDSQSPPARRPEFWSPTTTPTCATICRACSRLDFRSKSVGDGTAALEAVRRRPPDVIVSDVMMPGLDGFQLLAALRADEAIRTIPFILLSARAGEEARIDGLHAGADDYLVKPFSARELIARVDAQLVRAKMRSLEEAQAVRLASVFAHAPVGIATLKGAAHVFEFANRRYLDLIGGRPVEGKPIRDALPELEGQGIYELLDGVYQSGEPFEGRSVRVMIQRQRSAPEEAFFDFVYQPLFDDAAQVTGIAIVAFDVTELTNARRDAEAANRAKDEFLAMLGHELRNPLAPILTALQLMRLRNESGAERERTIIERQVNHMVSLVDDLLDVSRITRGKVQLRRERIDLADIVAKAIEMTSPAIESRRHTLTVDVPRGLIVDGDAARLAQVTANLLTNAAKYTDPGGQIAVSGSSKDSQAVLTVIDTGRGIAPDMLPRIFDLFAQERQEIDRSDGGLGLGLAIVKSLMRAHGGTVDAHSEGKNRGARFSIRMPLAARAPEAPGIESPAAPAQVSPAVAWASDSGRRRQRGRRTVAVRLPAGSWALR